MASSVASIVLRKLFEMFMKSSHSNLEHVPRPHKIVLLHLTLVKLAVASTACRTTCTCTLGLPLTQ